MAIAKENVGSPISEEQPERCTCNKLICIVNGDNIEIKCNKCKRIMVIKTEGIVAVEVS